MRTFNWPVPRRNWSAAAAAQQQVGRATHSVLVTLVRVLIVRHDTMRLGPIIAKDHIDFRQKIHGIEGHVRDTALCLCTLTQPAMACLQPSANSATCVVGSIEKRSRSTYDMPTKDRAAPESHRIVLGRPAMRASKTHR